MKRRQFLAAAGAAMFHIRRTPGSARQESSFEETAGLIREKMAEHHVPGVAFGVMQNGRVAARGFGVTSLASPQPVTPETLFPIASISKTFTTTALFNLIQQKRAELKAPVRRYLPDFRVQDEAISREVQIWHLLTHTPGWEGQLNTEDHGDNSLAVFTEGMKDLPPLAHPGEVWSYNNAGFAVAGRIIETITGKNIHDSLADLVYRPIGLTQAFSRTAAAMKYPFALGHRQVNGNTVGIVPFELPANVTAGGIATSTSELLRYAAFHLGNGAGAEGKAVVDRSLLEMMRAPQLKKNSTDDEMGVGWHLRRLHGVMTAAHGGTLGGHCLHIQLVPERNLAFVILTNHGDGWRLIQDVERAVLKRYGGLALAENQAIAHRGVSEAMNAHARPLAKQPSLKQYAGTYRRPPLGSVEVQDQDGTLAVFSGADNSNRTTLVFYGSDIAYATSGGYLGMPYEFVRKADGTVGWIRINGRIAMRAG